MNIDIKSVVLPRVLLLLSCGMFFVPFSLTARKKKAEDNSAKRAFHGEWKVNGAVTKLYDTPLGEVFRFNPTNPFLYCKDGRNPFDNQLNSIQFELYKNSKERKNLKRFIVINFKIRVFPAILESENPRLYFVLTRSMNSSNSIQKLRNINGQSAYFNYCLLHPPRSLKFTKTYSYRKIKKGKMIIRENVKQNACAYLGHSFLPAYDIVSMRLIIDTSLDGIVTSNVNKAFYWTLRKYASPEKEYPVRSFGILVTDIEVRKLGKNRNILELSKPEIILMDNEADIQKLPSVEFTEYPYEGYIKMYEESKKKKKKRNLKHLDNPDETYANALHLLKGEDLVEGVELLTYVAKKKEHILAMNQLGICYWRGIGVDPDPAKALVWFKRAGKYYLQDALAYGGALCLKRAAAPYISENDKRYIGNALTYNRLGYNNGKDSTSVLSAVLNYGHAGNRSAKSGYWKAKNCFLPVFYRNTLYEDEGPRISREGLTSGYEKSRYIKNRFYDIRKRYIGNNRLPEDISRKMIDDAVKKNFPAAIYFKGQLLIAEADRRKEKMEPAIKKAMALFKRGERLGDLECAIEVLHCKARLGLLKQEDFDDKSYTKFSDHPLYYLLRYMAKNPSAPGVKEFLERKYRDARRIWRQKLDGISHFLLALEGIYQYFHYGANTVMYRIYYGHIHDIKTAYSHLDAAVKANIPDAIYLKGVYLINRKYNNFASMKNRDIYGGINLLNKLASQNIKAQYYIIKNDFYNNKRIDKKWLTQLKKLRNLNFPDAWLLSCDILARLYQGDVRKKQQVTGAYKKAASLGCVRAWDKLARFYYDNGRADGEDKIAAGKYWRKFLEADRKQRRNDPWDPYWPKPEPHKVIIPRSDGSLPVDIYGKKDDPKGYKILLAYLKKYYNIDVAKIKDNRFQILKGGPRDAGPIADFEHSKFK